MCGITLTCNFSGEPIDPRILARMTDALAEADELDRYPELLLDGEGHPAAGRPVHLREHHPGEVGDLAEGLGLGDAIKISSIALPDNVHPTITDRDFTIAGVTAPSSMKSDSEEEEDEEGVEGEEAEGAEGEGEGDDAAATAAAEAKVLANANSPLANMVAFNTQNYFHAERYGIDETANIAWLRYAQPFG